MFGFERRLVEVYARVVALPVTISRHVQLKQDEHYEIDENRSLRPNLGDFH